MSETRGPDLLERVLDQVVDRATVNWEAITPQPEGSDQQPPDADEALSLLRLLDELGDVNRAFQEGEYPDFDDQFRAPDTSGETPGIAPPATGRVPLATWGRYKLEDMVGGGGFGDVYRAWDPVLQMPVAIKILRQRHQGDSRTEQLIAEGRLLAKVKHPNVVRVLNVEEHDGRFGLVMEYLRGETLDQMVTTRGMLNHREATVIVEDICRALSAVHDVRLVHRDVKARNIIREYDGRFVLMDFGAGFSQGSATADVGAVGTPLYMAPEVLGGGPSTFASDVYAVGVLLFYLVTRRYPYEGHTVDDIRAAHKTGRRQALLSLRSDLPHAYVKVVERALAADPRERFDSPGALLQALLDARTTARDWTQVALRVGAGVAGLAVLLTVGGAITSGVFNLTLGRRAYATEGIVEWFVLGRRSLVGPLVLALMGVAVVGIAIAVRHLVLGLFPSARGLDARLEGLWDDVASRLRLKDPTYSSCWLLVLTATCLVGAWIAWMPLLDAVMSDVSTAPASLLQVFTEPQVEYRGYYRMVLSILAAANITGWYGLVRFSRGRGLALPKWLPATETVLLTLVLLSMQVPYRLVHDTDEFPAASVGDQRCYLLGDRGGTALVFCPALTPRTREVAQAAVRVDPLAPRESIFTAFAPSTR